jgi:hypothetical protein
MSIPEREIDAAVKKAFAMPGLYGRDEARFLYKLARRKGNFVEIGVWMGRTTALLQQAAQVWGATLTSIDPFIPIKGRAIASPERWAANLKRQNITPPTLHVAPSAEIAAGWTEPLALVFIDGAHDYAAVLRDLQLWTPFIVSGGTVALHDMFGPLIPGVAEAVNVWWQSEHDDWKARWQCLGQVNLTVAFRRVV